MNPDLPDFRPEEWGKQPKHRLEGMSAPGAQRPQAASVSLPEQRQRKQARDLMGAFIQTAETPLPLCLPLLQPLELGIVLTQPGTQKALASREGSRTEVVDLKRASPSLDD